VVIDPISSYLGKVDSHKNAEVRAVLEPVSALAARRQAAILSVTHLNKAGGGSANHRIIGSIAFVAVARGSYVVCQDPDDRDRGLFIPSKNNLGPRRAGLAFRIRGVDLGGGIVASKAVWEPEAVTLTANEALAAAAGAAAVTRGAPQRETAEDFLRDLLKDGPRPVREIEAEAAGAGFAMRTVRRARENLGLVAAKAGMNGDWVWSLPLRRSGAG
jgi:putative DNA primase/helicase